MKNLGSIACGTIGLVFSALLMIATVAPVPADTKPEAKAVPLCIDATAGTAKPCPIFVA